MDWPLREESGWTRVPPIPSCDWPLCLQSVREAQLPPAARQKGLELVNRSSHSLQKVSAASEPELKIASRNDWQAGEATIAIPGQPRQLPPRVCERLQAVWRCWLHWSTRACTRCATCPPPRWECSRWWTNAVRRQSPSSAACR